MIIFNIFAKFNFNTKEHQSFTIMTNSITKELITHTLAELLQELKITNTDEIDFISSIIKSFSSDETEVKKALLILLSTKEILEISQSELNLDNEPAVAYLLHELSKMKKITANHAATLKLFSEGVLEILSGLNKIDKLDTSKYSNQTDNFIKLLLTISDDLRVILTKLAQRLYQMRNLLQEEIQDQKKIAAEIQLLYSPIAHRIGLYSIKSEFEDLCMKFFNPEVYLSINEKLAVNKAGLEKYINDFVAPIKQKVLEHDLQCRVFGRVKSIPSIWKKMQTQEVEFEKVYDLFAIRVIVDTQVENEKADCWKVFSLVTEEYTANPKRMRDWITVPKSSGYESLHTTVIGPEGKWVEVQIRTERMDEIAEKGYASHWKYKDKSSREQQLDLFAKIREALQKPTGLKQNLTKEKKALYSDEIFVFTPKGDLKKFKSGHSVLDFAYDIHTDVGHCCTGAVVNDKMVSFRHILNNGDTVKILTSKNQKPNHSWLEFVKSSKAAAKIKQSLKADEYKYADEGKQILKHKFEQIGIDFTDVNILVLVDFYKCETVLDLYQQMGEGKLDSTKIKKVLLGTVQQEQTKAQLLSEIEQEPISNYNFDDSKGNFLEIDNQAVNFAYMYSKCCNPVPGDKIFAFVSVSQGLKIHKTSCRNARALITNYPYRIIEARWRKASEDAPLLAQIKIVAKGSAEAAHKIVNYITNDLKLMVKGSQVESQSGGNVTFKVAVNVNGKEHLTRIINRLKKFKDIKSAQRAD